jgi:Bax protein
MAIQKNLELLSLCFLLGLAMALLQPAGRGLPQPLAAFQAAIAPAQADMNQAIIQVSSHDDLGQVFASRDYDLTQIQNGHSLVPALFLTSLPQDLHEINQPAARKDLFIRSVLPLALLVNQHLAEKRAKIENLWQAQLAGKKLSTADYEWSVAVANEYGLDQPDYAALMLRVDVIPPSLLIAQAAEESGWGTSRFTRHGNALFGQQVYDPNLGILPADRGENRKFYVRSFNNLFHTILSYTRNLNSHRAYGEFRALRAAQREGGGQLNSLRLIETLIGYSERREAYVRTIQSIITRNDLRELDGARLAIQNASIWRDRFI